MKVKTGYSLRDNENLKERWLQIQSLNKYRNNPFIFYHRFCAWEEENNLTGRYQLVIVTVEIDDKIVIIAPFAIRKTFGVRIIYFAGAQYADYNDILVDEGFENMVNPMLNKFLRQRDIMILRGIREDSIFYKLVTCQELELHSFKHKQTTSPYIDLENEEIELSTNVRKSTLKDVQYNIRRLEKNGNLELYTPKDEEESLIMLESLFEMHINEWNQKGMKSLFEDEICRKYYKRLITIGNRNETNMFLTSIKHDNKYLAILFGQKQANTIYYYKPAFDYDMRKFSPGKIMIYYLIKQLEGKEKSKLDFLVGDEKYKYDWTSSEENIHSIFLTSRSFIGKRLINYQIRREKKYL